MEKKHNRNIITAALPYANGPVHIGHLAGVYIPADIFVRYLKQKEEDVLFVCGSDEHGVPITIKAKKEGVLPQDIVDRFHNLNKKAFNDFGICFDIYSRTTSATHKKTASEMFRTLHEKGVFIEKKTNQYYDSQENQFLADRYITGTCPHCSNPSAYGDQCESCGTSLNAIDLINPKSSLSGNVPILKETKHWFLPLDKYEGFLREWILEQNKNWRSNVYGQCKSWLDAGLQPRAVSRDLDWGIPVPLEGAEGKALYVWFDAPIGYISATKELTPEWEKYWKNDDSRLIHFIGKDNIVFHCIIFPTMLKAEGSYILPDNVPSNEFLNLEGQKISTSNNWAVWLHEYLEDFEGKQDDLRFVLTANAPESKDNDFTWKDFQKRCNNELVAVLGNFVNRAIVLTHKYYDGKIPAPGILNDYDEETLKRIPVIKETVENSLYNFRIREAQNNAMELARLGNKYLAETEPWKLQKTDPERVKSIIYVALQITANLSSLLDAFLPNTCKKIQDALNISLLPWKEIGNKFIIEPGHKIDKIGLLFEKVEDKAVDIQLKKLENSKKQNQMQSKEIPPQKPNISFDDFLKMDMRVGKVLEAEKVPKTKKLMKLKVDTGIDTRTVVSGIAEYYDASTIVGKQVTILLNLEPRKIKGIESQGMILMAENSDGTLKFLAPTEEVGLGSQIS